MRPQDAIQHLRSRPVVALLMALFVFLVAFALRYSFGNELYTVPFITLFPAILISALIGGLWVGVIVAILSAIAAWLWTSPAVRNHSAPLAGRLFNVGPFCAHLLYSALRHPCPQQDR